MLKLSTHQNDQNVIEIINYFLIYAVKRNYQMGVVGDHGLYLTRHPQKHDEVIESCTCESKMLYRHDGKKLIELLQLFKVRVQLLGFDLTFLDEVNNRERPIQDGILHSLIGDAKIKCFASGVLTRHVLHYCKKPLSLYYEFVPNPEDLEELEKDVLRLIPACPPGQVTSFWERI